MAAALAAVIVIVLLLSANAQRNEPTRMAVRLIRSAIRRDCALPALDVVRRRCRELLIAMRRLEADSHRLPDRHTPAETDSTDALCSMIRREHPQLSAEALLTGLRTWQRTQRTLLAQREALPCAMQQLLVKELIPRLREVCRDADDWLDGEHLADRLIATRKPLRLLLKNKPSAACMGGMIRRLREKEQHELLAALEGLMHEAGVSMSRMQERHMHRQAALAEAIAGAADSIHLMQQLDWPKLEEAADPLHEALLDDPSGIYPRMSSSSRRSLRKKAAQLAGLFHADELRTVRAALSLAREAQDDPPQDYTGYWLTVPEGQLALRRRLHAGGGWLSIMICRYRTAVAAVMAIIDCAVWTVFYLSLGMPVIAAMGGGVMLAAPVRMMMLRILGRIWPETPLPEMAIEHIGDSLRTLVVLPAELGSREEAIACMRQLILAKSALGSGAIDFLLLGDYTANPTLRAGRDHDICTAAAAAVEATDSPDHRVMYMQRERSWDAGRRCFAGEGSLDGLLLCLTHLLADGTHGEAFEFATVPSEELHRRYAYVLVLPRGAKLMPGMLPRLIGVLEHPLSSRRQVSAGTHGTSMVRLPALAESHDPASLFAEFASSRIGQGGVLFRPDAFADDTSLLAAASPLTGAAQQLTGAVSAGDVCMLIPAASCYRDDALIRWQHVYDLFHSLSWILGKASASVHAQYEAAVLRTSLWRALTPVMAMLSVISAILLRTALPLLPVLVAALVRWLTERTRPVRAVLEAVMLPFHAILHAHGAWLGLRDALRERPAQQADAILTDRRRTLAVCWSQGLSAALAAMLALTQSPPSWSGLIIGAVFACFVWLPDRLNQHRQDREHLDAASQHTLAGIAQGTWQWFDAHTGDDTHHLLPAREQIDPPRGPEMIITPDAAAGYLLAAVSACELSLISPDEAAVRLGRAADTLSRLDRRDGLFFDRYSMEMLAPEEPLAVTAVPNGLVCAALMVSAQMLRSRLSDIAPEHHALPFVLDNLASDMQLSHLYDLSSGLFCERKDQSPERKLSWFASPALLLCMVSMMRGEAPPSALAGLDRSMVRAGIRSVMLSPDGSIADYALPALFLPYRSTAWGKSVRQAMQLHVKSARQGIFGLSEAASDAFDVTLRSKRERFGLRALAAQSSVMQYAFAPYAAALSLPWTGKDGVDVLRRMQSASMSGPQGFFDSVIMRGAAMQPVQVFDALHQGLLLCAVCEALSGTISHHFMSIPSAEAWSALLLKPLDPPEHIPGLAVLAQSKAASVPELTRSASSLQLPPDATVIGSESASALVTADGFTHMRGEGLHWSVFTGEALQPEGLRICISDGRRSVRIGQGSRASFGEGHASFTQTLGMLQIRLTIACDPTTRTIWHLVQVTNTSSEAREIFVSDLLLPSMQPDGTSSPLSVERIDDRALLGPADMHGSRLCHTVCADAPCTVSPCTRCDAFAGQPAEALCTAGKQDACMGFACRLLIEKGSCAAAAFATALVCGSVPEHMRYAPGEEKLMSVARIYAGIQAEHIGTSPEMAMRSMHLTGAVLWHGLAHQGAAEPLHVSAADLCALGVDAKLPFVLLSLQHDDYAEMLDDTLIFAALLHMRGWPVAVVILCREAMEDDVRRTLGCVPTACTSGLTITVLVSEHLQEGTRAALEAAARLILCSGYDALAQLRQCVKRLYRLDSFACPAASAADISGLLFSDEYGGFEPHTKAYIQYVHHGSPTASWTRMLSGRHIGMRISSDGISGTFAGPVLKTQLTSTEVIFAEEDGMRFSPCGFPYGHAQHVIHTPGAAEWHATAAELDMQLICAVMPDDSAGIRLWRLHNTSRRTRTLTLHAVASFIMGEADGSLTAVTSLSNLAIAASPSSGLHGFLAAPEGGYETLTMSTGSLRATLGLHGAFAEAQHEGIGCAVLLRRPLTLAPDETHEAVFVIGAAKTSDEIESMLVTVRSRGAAALIESAQSTADTKLDRLTVTTPDDAFNLMLNRLLPAFLLAPYPAQLPFAHLLAAAAFLPCGSHRMQSALLCAFARPPKCVRERLLLALLTAWYISRTGDEDVLHAPIPVTDDTRDDRRTLLLHMMRLLTGVKLAPDGLPLTKQHSDLTAGLMYIAALKAFQPFLPEDDQPDAQRMTEMVTSAAERALPDDASCLASCWAVFAGLRPSLPRACEPADFSETIPYLHALCMTEQYDDAWKLIGWLNPVLHHDAVTPAWQPEPDGSQMTSAWLYVTVLEQLLGLQRHGNKLQLKPHLPEDWHECTIAMQVGASRWYITLTDDVRLIQTDGVISGGDSIILTDDGLEHHVRWPLNRR